MIFDGLTQNISRIELTPDEPVNRLNDRRYLDVYYQDGEGYHKLDPEDWEFSLDGPTGRITIAFPDLLTAYEVRIHCRYDDRDADYQPINASEFNNLAQSMVKVYRVYDYRNESYAYDANGNRLSETITTLYPKTFDYNYYNNSDRLKTRISTDGAMKWAFVYDNNGNLVKKGNTFTSFGETVDYTVEGEGVIYWEYDYDVFNRLTAVRKNGAETSRYVYDPVGLRIYKDGTKDVLYDYDLGGNVICETDLGTGEVRSYVWVAGRHLARVDGVIGGAGEKYFYECDHLGSPQVVTGQSSEPDEIVVWRGDFTPFGEKIEGEWAFVDTHGFTGKDWDEDAGLYYFNARWYDPELGRFITEDPIGDPNNPNLYVYCANSPVKRIDPTGNEIIDFSFLEPLSNWLAEQAREGGQWVSEQWQWVSEQWERAMNAISGQGLGYKTTEEIGQEWTAEGKYGWANWEDELKRNISSRLEELDLEGKTSEEKAAIIAQVAREEIEKLQDKYRTLHAGAASWGPSGPIRRKLAPLMSISFDEESTFGGLVEAFQSGFSAGVRIGLITAVCQSARQKPGTKPGKLTIVEGGTYTESEIAAAKYMQSQGYDVVLRPAIGTRAAGGTSDLLVNGLRYDVYTPTTSNPDRIISAIAKKNTQAVGIVLDLSKTNVTLEQLGSILARVQGAGATNIIDVVILGR